MDTLIYNTISVHRGKQQSVGKEESNEYGHSDDMVLMLENVLKQCKSNALRPLVTCFFFMVRGPIKRGGQPQTKKIKRCCKALGVKTKRKGEKSHPATIGSYRAMPSVAYKTRHQHCCIVVYIGNVEDYCSF